MLRKTLFGSATFAILLLMVAYPLSDLMPNNRCVDNPDLTTTAGIQQAYGKLPLLFIENQGQLDSTVEYYIKSPAQTLYLTQDGIVFDLTRHSQAERLVFRLDFLNSNSSSTVEGVDKNSAVVNYFTGNDPGKWHTDIPTYNEVVYHDIYPSVDLRLFSKGNALEYDFVVGPGARPEDIALAYEGIDGLRIEDSRLVAASGFGDIEQYKPYIYQQIGGEKVQVDGGFKLGGGNTYGFQVAAYDNRYPLVIDPMLAYSTYLGGSGDDVGYSIAVDSAGCAYVGGDTNSANFPTQNSYQGTDAGDYDVFVAKLSPAGNSLIYSTYLGGSSFDLGFGIAVDSSGSAYVTGRTFSGNFPTRNPYQGTNAGDWDTFVARLSAAGNSLIYSTYLGGSDYEQGQGIAVDASGSAYVTGETFSSDFPTKNAYQVTYAGNADAFVSRLDTTKSDGPSLVYSTYLGGSNLEVGVSIAVGAASGAYVTGYTFSAGFPTQNSYQGTNGGGGDAFVTRLSATGNSLTYSTFLGGSGDDEGFGIAVDASGGAYVTGYTGSFNFPTRNPIQGTLAGDYDVFVTGLSAAGNSLIYSTYLGGSADDSGSGIAVDASGSAYITGSTYSTNFPTQNAYQGTNAGDWDIFVARLSAVGNSLTYSTYLGGSGDDFGDGIVVDAAGGAYVTGQTISNDFPTENPYQGTRVGNNDAFVSKIALASPTVTTNAATNVGVSSATLNMSFTLGEFDQVEVRFAYKTSGASTWTYIAFVPETAAGSYAETVTGLVPGVQYSFMAQVGFASTVIDGATLQFATGYLTQPKVSPSLPRQLNQAQVSVQYLNVSPQQTAANQPVTITTNVVNTGDEAGSLNVALRINGQVEQTRMVSVGPQATQPVKFTVSKSEPGTYTVDIYDQNSSFTVLANSNTASKPVNGGLIILAALAVLVLAAAVVLVLSFRRSA
jgi:hypothetical protein